MNRDYSQEKRYQKKLFLNFGGNCFSNEVEQDQEESEGETPAYTQNQKG